MHIADKKWIDRFYDLAMFIASWSKDPDKKVGSLLVSPDGRRMSPGYNGLPKKISDPILHSLRKETKRAISLHAESNALDNCPTDVTGWYIFVTESPCSNCAGRIIQNGISTVVCPPINKKSSWARNQMTARILFDEAKVNVLEVTK